MSFQKSPGGTRGARVPPSNAVTRTLNRVAMSWHRRSGDTFQGQDLLYLTTVGAKTGQKRQTAVARFPDGEDAWLVVASAAGSAHHPAWYHNIAAHPDQVWIEFGGRQLRVTPTQLDGDERAQAWQRITQLQPRYAGYERKTDRVIPVIRLSRAGWGPRTARGGTGVRAPLTRMPVVPESLLRPVVAPDIGPAAPSYDMDASLML